MEEKLEKEVIEIVKEYKGRLTDSEIIGSLMEVIWKVKKLTKEN